MITCGCGCGTLIEPRDKKNRPRKYVWGHANIKNLIEGNKGKSPWNKGKKLHYDVWNKGKEWPRMCGENNPSWRGGVTKIRGDRWTKEYRRWRNAVLRRDNHTCVSCSATREEDVIQVDHIKPFASYPNLRFDVNNGRTLCWACHKKTKTYGMSGRRVLDKKKIV